MQKETRDFMIIPDPDSELCSLSTSGLSSLVSQSPSLGNESQETSGTLDSTSASSKRKSRAPPSVLELNRSCTSLPYEKFPYNEAIAAALDDFEPYKPLVESKHYPTVKVWVLMKKGNEMVVRLEDCTKHIKLIHQVLV